jgi:hypothetical protein
LQAEGSLTVAKPATIKRFPHRLRA